MAKDNGKKQDRESARKAREQTKRENATDRKIDKLNKDKKLSADEKLRKLLEDE